MMEEVSFACMLYNFGYQISFYELNANIYTIQLLFQNMTSRGHGPQFKEKEREKCVRD